MPIPSTPSYAQMPNNLSELLKFGNNNMKLLKGNYKSLSKGLTNLTKVTNLTKKRITQVNKFSKELKKIADIAKKSNKVTDLLKKGKFKSVNPKLGMAIGFALNLASIGLTLLTINQVGKLQETQIKVDDVQNKDLSKSFERAVNNTLKLDKIKNDLKNFIKTYKDDKDRLFAEAGISQASATAARENSERAKQQANDALYETRAGRSILESQITTVVNDFNQLQGEIITQNRELAIRTNDAYKIGNDALYEVREGRNKLEKKISILQGEIRTIDPTQNLANISNQLEQIQSRSNEALITANRALQVKAQPGPAGKPGRDGLPGVAGRPGLQGPRGLTGPRGLQGLRGLIGPRGYPGINGINGKNGKDGRDGKDGRNGKDVNQNQYEELLRRISLIPPLVARVPGDTVKQMPKPLTSPQVEAATGRAVCKSTRPGGCMNKSLNNTANTINRNTNNWGRSILDKLNAAANAAQLALLKKIDYKLGPQLPGGLSKVLDTFKKTFDKFVEWSKIERILIVFTWVNTLHNAYMLSSSLADTLFSIVDNVAGIFIKDINGKPISTQSFFGQAVDKFAATLFGLQSWKDMKLTWKKWNRIYGAAANIANTVRSMIDSLRGISEFIAENTGRIGNALKKFGVVGETAFPAMPEQVNAKSIWVNKLEALNEAAEGINMVTSEALSLNENIAELKLQSEVFRKSIEESPKNKGVENKAVQQAEKESKEASKGVDLSKDDKKEFDA